MSSSTYYRSESTYPEIKEEDLSEVYNLLQSRIELERNAMEPDPPSALYEPYFIDIPFEALYSNLSEHTRQYRLIYELSELTDREDVCYDQDILPPDINPDVVRLILENLEAGRSIKVEAAAGGSVGLSYPKNEDTTENLARQGPSTTTIDSQPTSDEACMFFNNDGQFPFDELRKEKIAGLHVIAKFVWFVRDGRASKDRSVEADVVIRRFLEKAKASRRKTVMSFHWHHKNCKGCRRCAVPDSWRRKFKVKYVSKA